MYSIHNVYFIILLIMRTIHVLKFWKIKNNSLMCKSKYKAINIIKL